MNITWQEGDLNYDGQVTISDFIDLASNFNASYSGGALPISAGDQKTPADFSQVVGGASVPEPTMGCVVLLAGGLMMRRARTSRPKDKSLTNIYSYLFTFALRSRLSPL